MSDIELKSQQRKIAMVTGALGGIGTAICKKLIANDYFIIATVSQENPERIKKWCAEHNFDSTDFEFITVDLTAHEQTIAVIEDTISKYDNIYALINSAGITRDSSFKKMTFEQWKQVVDCNLMSLYTVIHPIFLKMLKQKSGRIVNISSINGLRGQYGQTNYSAAKAGIIGFTKALAYEGASSFITANVVAPGYTLTPMVESVPEHIMDKIKETIPMNRLAYASEIAAACMYLISDEAQFVTGETISVNGGQYMS
ncbi:acetoacetyl-CoA reductase [Psychrobacter sanguinis]|uniref:acetoacetyl-CoA reductase n=1 Tax=Psychrobacter sanguinis TaxID=861445 RepID=UPI000E92DAF6|nr:acetoacetyl-CoA reductase [Psychrobacter sanguinis]HBH33010.1 beta-ketoacyl-ACP reductase [Psychrobacter sp.]